MVGHLSDIIQTAIGRGRPYRPSWVGLPHALLAVSMSVFYACRWVAGQEPPSTKGLLFAAEDFYGMSALWGLLVWPCMVEVSARALNAFSSNTDADLIELARMRYAYPLFFWLGTVEFLFWALTPAAQFRIIAPLLLLVSMTMVIFQYHRTLRTTGRGWGPRLALSILCLLPQLLIAGLFIR